MKDLYKNVFISGPMTGYEDDNFPAFLRAEELIERFTQLRTHSMRKLVVEQLGNDRSLSREIYLNYSLHELTHCGIVVMLDQWQSSAGAIWEHDIATRLKKSIWKNEVDFVDHWLIHRHV